MLFPPLEMVKTAVPFSVPPEPVVTPPKTVSCTAGPERHFAPERDFDHVARRDIREFKSCTVKHRPGRARDK